MEAMKRTHTCGELRAQDEGKTIILNGWVHRNRDHGGIHFINLRDRYGITQVVVGPEAEEALEETAKNLKFEYCVAVEGIVRKRPDEMINREMASGEIEVEAKKISILSTCQVLPFMIDEKSEAKDELRLKYRFLDLRSFSMQEKIALRNKVAHATREFFQGEEFYEIETPTLIKSTPEGARDFLVPARLNPGKFFALPQSPQLFKQILMVSGFDKYYQIARCYRDEDARGDRQLEFTQVDVEMSFVSRDDILAMTERMISSVFKKSMNVDIPTPFPRLTYAEAMERYGSDKPELRFSMELQDFAPFVPGADFQVFKSVLESGGPSRPWWPRDAPVTPVNRSPSWRMWPRFTVPRAWPGPNSPKTAWREASPGSLPTKPKPSRKGWGRRPATSSFSWRISGRPPVPPWGR